MDRSGLERCRGGEGQAREPSTKRPNYFTVGESVWYKVGESGGRVGRVGRKRRVMENGGGCEGKGGKKRMGSGREQGGEENVQ